MKPGNRTDRGARREISRRTFLKQSGAVAAIVGGHGLTGLPGIARADAPVWIDIPDQNWTVGVPVFLDLRDYCTDPDGDPLTFVLDKPLPDGVTLEGSIISGTPTSAQAASDYVATADDSTIVPAAPSDLIAD